MNPMFLLNLFAGPISGMAEKAILSAVMYGVGKGVLPADQAAGIAAMVYAVGSHLFTFITRTQTAKIQSVNGANNGAVVVPELEARRSGIRPVDAPLDISPTGGAG